MQKSSGTLVNSKDSLHEYTDKISAPFKETVIFGLINWQELLDISVNHFSVILIPYLTRDGIRENDWKLTAKT